MDGKFCSARAREVDKMGRSKKEGKRHRDIGRLERFVELKEERRQEKKNSYWHRGQREKEERASVVICIESLIVYGWPHNT